jgi:glycosyl transferase family 87
MALNLSDQGRRYALIAAAALLFIGLGYSTLYRAAFSPHHRTDFTVYTAAGKAVVNGTNIYEAHNIRGWYYMYLPVFAVVMVPFAMMSTFWASFLWYLMSVAALVHGFVLSIRLVRRAFPEMRMQNDWLCALSCLLVLPPLLSGVARGQASVMIMYLMILGIWFYYEKRPWLSGIAFAGAIVLKIFPALLVLYFLIQRRFRFAVATAVWLLLLVIVIPSAVFGPAKNLKLLRRWNTTVAVPANKGVQEAVSRARYDQMIDPRNRRNQSTRAVIIRTASGREVDIEDENEEIARPIALVANAFFFLMTTWVCFLDLSADSMRRSLFKISAVILLMLMISPVTWNHNFVLLLLPLVVAIAAWRSARESDTALFGWALVGYGIGIGLSPVDLFGYFGSAFWGTVLLWSAFVRALLKDRIASTADSKARAAATLPAPAIP